MGRTQAKKSRYEDQRGRRRTPVVTVRDVRLAYGWTLPQLAAAIRETGYEVSVEHLNNCELGIRGASAELLVAWSKALAVSGIQSDWAPRAAPTKGAAA